MEKPEAWGSGCRLQQRDLELVQWINGFGFAEIGQIAGKWGVSYSTAQIWLAKLVKAGLLARERVLFGGAYAMRPTAAGVRLAGDGLGRIKRIGLGTYPHDRAVVSLAVRLEKETHGVYEPERRLRRRLGKSGAGNPGHVPDGLLRLPGANKPIAIEVELSAKPRQRLREIVCDYRKTFDYSEVHYYCGKESLAARVRCEAKGDPLFKVEVLE